MSQNYHAYSTLSYLKLHLYHTLALLLCLTYTHKHNHIQMRAFILPKDALSPQHVLPLSNTSHRVHCLSKLYMRLRAVSKLLLLRMSVNTLHTHTLTPSLPSNNRLICTTGLPLKRVLSRLKCWGLSSVSMPAAQPQVCYDSAPLKVKWKCHVWHDSYWERLITTTIITTTIITLNCKKSHFLALWLFVLLLVLPDSFGAVVTEWCGDRCVHISTHHTSVSVRLPPTTFLQMALSSSASLCYLMSL